ncbi:MAG: hypothetical protein ACI87E_003392 [Mariniblastus sp.]|jgi:hypothetical protein
MSSIVSAAQNSGSLDDIRYGRIGFCFFGNNLSDGVCVDGCVKSKDAWEIQQVMVQVGIGIFSFTRKWMENPITNVRAWLGMMRFRNIEIPDLMRF